MIDELFEPLEELAAAPDLINSSGSSSISMESILLIFIILILIVIMSFRR